ncbi:MAG: hypothetical protein FD139_2672 [Methylocystaceae bacterium]|nr:MAG: hypothetical protein FD148_674 [Methylocystaceae bacterium]KAF0210420.1 MAG: hypothetical protein FD172_2657 [Methylocystaceae bacterium]TXT43839.1 MAG: hypothetical protein FD139_2672 [Methylocystaceae bacterium]
MTKLKLASIDDDKPVKLSVSLPAELHRNLIAYAEVLANETGKTVDPTKLIAPMLEKFIASDRGFRKMRGRHPKPSLRPSETSAGNAPTTSRALGCKPEVSSTGSDTAQ